MSSTTVVHLKKADYDVRIDRQSRWGNPFKIGEDGDRDEVIRKYYEWVTRSDDWKAKWIRENVHRLRGKTLGCWCAPNPCHGHVLAGMAEVSRE